MLTQKMKAEFSVYTKTSQWSAIKEKKSDEQKDMKVQSVEKSLKHTHTEFERNSQSSKILFSCQAYITTDNVFNTMCRKLSVEIPSITSHD